MLGTVSLMGDAHEGSLPWFHIIMVTDDGASHELDLQAADAGTAAAAASVQTSTAVTYPRTVTHLHARRLNDA